MTSLNDLCDDMLRYRTSGNLITTAQSRMVNDIARANEGHETHPDRFQDQRKPHASNTSSYLRMENGRNRGNFVETEK